MIPQDRPCARRCADANPAENPLASDARQLGCKRGYRAGSRLRSSARPRRSPEALARKCNQWSPIGLCRWVLLGEISIQRERDTTRRLLVNVRNLFWKTIPKLILFGVMIAFTASVQNFIINGSPLTPLHAILEESGGRTSRRA